MARELGPQNIHIAHVIVDGVIDNPWSRKNFPKIPLEEKLNPDHIAETYWNIYCQPRNCWTFELEVRPFGEKW